MIYNWKSMTDEAKVKFILGNQERAEKTRAVYNDLRETIIKIFRPRRYDLLGLGTKGKRFGAKVYDQKPANALSKFTGGRVGYMVNRSVPWIQFVTVRQQKMLVDRIKIFLDDLARQVLFGANRSTFYSAVYPASMDADTVGIGTMVPIVDETKDRVVFDVVHPRDSYVISNEFGDAEVFHRKPLELTRASAERMFGAEKLPSVWYDGDNLKHPFETDKYIWSVYPNSDREHDSLSHEDLPYRVLIILLDQISSDKSRLVYERGREYFPIIYRPGRDSGCDYGTSIAAECLTAALVANKLSEKAVTAAHLAVEPRHVASKTLRNTLRRRPGSTTWVDDINREGIKTWDERLNWPITDAQTERLDKIIEDKMFIRFFEMLSAGDIKVRTAYEVSQMMAEKATLMSVIVDTFEQECLAPAIDIIMAEEQKAGRLPDVPPELEEDGGLLDIRFSGPLSQLQRSLLRSKGTIDALSLLQQMMNMNEKVGWILNWPQVAEDVMIAQGMPQRHILSEAEQQRILEENEQKQQAAEAAALLESGGKAAPGLAKAPEEGSPLDQALVEAGSL